MAKASVLKAVDNLSEPTNSGADIISLEMPFRVAVTIQGEADLLFHRWGVESVIEKAKAKKGSAAKKSDDIESYIWRNEINELCLPGEYVRQSIIHAAKFSQDPRSPRKSAMDLTKAAVISLTPLAPIASAKGETTTEWDYLDTRRVVVGRAGINRTRPAMRAGWKANFIFMSNLPEYVGPSLLREVLDRAGKLIGVGDFRPSYGRFVVTQWEILPID